MPADENERLCELEELEATEELPEPRFSAIAAAAARVCSTPIALVNLVGADSQHFKGSSGVTATGMDRADSWFCPHTIAARRLLEVHDADADPRFRDTPIVAGEWRVRFYAGAPMISSRGHALGTVCVMDHRPRRLSPEQHQMLTVLAENAALLLEAHHQVRRADRIIHGLQDVQELKDQFLRNINHELRTPLTSIRSYLELIQDGDLDSATEQRFLGVIEHNSDRLLELIDELLLMASLNAETAVFHPARVDLIVLVHRALEVVADRVQDRGHTLILHAPDRATVWADALRFQHVLVHLLDNAIKFTPDGGTIEVRASADPAPRVEICDTGIGIGAEHVERIFEDFYRAPEAEERAIPGTGMGLAIVDKIIRVHGGSIRINSTPGEGTCVRVTMPVPPSPQSSAHRTPPSSPRPGL
ncbi:sensor histidine kinase [Planobispora rosea]|uniref:histidine kinase n=1 Tax=Planobispora rosea TaxID=35762 RepID=A0A8J3WGA6_PLARO|nr:GAF domain-containing sensor histidine kinase [Planobispora rosea]GGT01325.1 sensor histidine kinase [Planobispora rosea]GIH88233.1 sensor histidine kinase [Planobispora rosea]